MKKTANWILCTGAAHSNAHIDNCMVCLNHSWNKLFTCSVCGGVLKISGTGKTGKCRDGCGLHYITK